jgi:adenosine deaminase
MKKTSRRLAAMLAIVMALGIALSGCAGTAQSSDEKKVAAYFEIAKQNEASLIALLQTMPKGADIHNHPSGALEAEDVMDYAIENGYFFDRETKTFVAEKPSGDPSTYYTAEQMQSSGDGSDEIHSEVLGAVSMRDIELIIQSGENGHDHFFSAFDRIGDAYPEIETMYRSLFTRAVTERIGYLELFTDVDSEEIARIDAVKAEVLKEYADKGLEWQLEVNFIPTVSRNLPLDEFKAEFDRAIEDYYSGDRYVGITILSAEDNYVSQHDFDYQMAYIDEAYRKAASEHPNDPPKLALHSGELTMEYAAYASLLDRISDTIELGHTLRIDHGVSIPWEVDTFGLLKQMRDENIGVAICLTSNDVILNVDVEDHPFALYRAAGVPVALATDDEGLSRSNLTYEFVKAVQAFDLSYADAKELAYNAVNLSLLGDKAALLEGLDAAFASFEREMAQYIDELGLL